MLLVGHIPLLCDRSFELVEVVLVRVLNLVDVGLFLREQTGHFFILLSELWQHVLRLFDHPGKIGRILQPCLSSVHHSK